MLLDMNLGEPNLAHRLPHFIRRHEWVADQLADADI